MTCAVPRACHRRPHDGERLVGRGPGHGGHIGEHLHGGAVDGPGPGLHGVQHARRRLGQTGPVRDVELPGPGPPGGGVEGGAPLPGRDAGGRRAPARAVRLGQAGDLPAHRLVQGARRPGRRVGHARAGPGPRRRGVVGRQPRPRPGLRRLQARRHRHRRRAHGGLGGQGVGAPAVRRAPRAARRGVPRGGDPCPRAGRQATGAATSRPTTTPTSSPARRRWPGSWSSRCPTSAPWSCPAGAAVCWPASSSASRGRACGWSGSSPRRRPP